jgi:hypothetical protein
MLEIPVVSYARRFCFSATRMSRLRSVAWSASTKAKTGRGLPNGPYGLLGAVEGITYLSLLAIIVVFALQYANMGFIPEPLPSAQCFGN